MIATVYAIAIQMMIKSMKFVYQYYKTMQIKHCKHFTLSHKISHFLPVVQ